MSLGAPPAGRKSMPDLSESFKFNRRTLLLSAAGAMPILAMAARSAEAGAKVSQDVVHYQPIGKNGQDCDDCTHFVQPHACKLVEGDISPKGWCRLWVKRG
jgi:hypothetical protein